MLDFHAQSRTVAHDRDDEGMHGIQEVVGSTPIGSTRDSTRLAHFQLSRGRRGCGWVADRWVGRFVEPIHCGPVPTGHQVAVGVHRHLDAVVAHLVP